MFFDRYKRECVEVDILYKCNIVIVIYFFVYLFVTFFDFLKYDVYVFSRFYRNLRLNFCFFNNVVKSKVLFITKRRKLAYALVLYLYDLIGVNFFFFFESLIFDVFRIFFSYSLCLYLIINKSSNFFKLLWNDVYSSLIETNQLIIYKDVFLFKLVCPKLIYYLYVFFLWLWLGIIYLSFLGLRFFFYKRFFFFKFFIRVL